MSVEEVPLLNNNNKSSDALSELATVSSDKSSKNINTLGSFSLIVNNLCGPAMLQFPFLFQQAGIIPTIVCILFVFLCSTLNGTLLADSIASIPGNKNFTRNVEFSTAFRLTAGDSWYILAEGLFVISCVVQACAGLVEAAQSLDSILASYLLGSTWAFQFYPEVKLIPWTPVNCHDDGVATPEATLGCTPFGGDGMLVLSLGFLLTTFIFLPLGTANLKETIFVQLIAFGSMAFLLSEFSFEFLERGFPTEVPWFGHHTKQLAGIVLFNYAYIITVPSWLNEKKPDVSVNRIIWGTSTLASLIYIGFGLVGAMSFDHISSNALVMLASSKVHYVTRICAALFGITIIGSGVPVFCVIIKNTLINSNVCSPNWAFFWGALFPYIASWMLYQGTALANLLNWTGLVVNGLVCFLLPMILILKTIALTSQRKNKVFHSTATAPTVYEALVSDDAENAETNSLIVAKNGNIVANQSIPSYQSVELTDDKEKDEEMMFAPSKEDLDDMISSVQPLPIWLEPFRKVIVLFMFTAFCVIIATTIVNTAVNGAQ